MEIKYITLWVISDFIHFHIAFCKKMKIKIDEYMIVNNTWYINLEIKKITATWKFSVISITRNVDFILQAISCNRIFMTVFDCSFSTSGPHLVAVHLTGRWKNSLRTLMSDWIPMIRFWCTCLMASSVNIYCFIPFVCFW